MPARMLIKNPVKLFNHCGSIRTLDLRIITTMIAWLLTDTKNGILLEYSYPQEMYYYPVISYIIHNFLFSLKEMGPLSYSVALH